MNRQEYEEQEGHHIREDAQEALEAQYQAEAEAHREAEDKAIAEEIELIEQEQEYRLGGEAYE